MTTPTPALAKKRKGSGSDEPFTYESPTLKETNDDGEEVPWSITVPSMSVMPRPNQYKLLRLQDEDPTGVRSTRFLFQNGIGKELLQKLEDLPGEEEEDFTRMWQEHSGITLGELKAS